MRSKTSSITKPHDLTMFYEIPSIPKYPELGATYQAHNVKEDQRIGFMYKGNMLFGNVVGCGGNSLIMEVGIYSF